MRNRRLIDDLDSRIIESLQSDGRLANTAIARRLGVAEATVRNRIGRMLRGGVLQFGAWTDPLKIGYQVYAIIELQVTLRDIEKVAERLAKLPEIFFLGTCLGNFDIFAAALFRSNEHLHTFLTKRLCRVPGIERASTTSLTRILKREYRYPMPSEPVLDGGGVPETSQRPRRSRSGRAGRAEPRRHQTPGRGEPAPGRPAVPRAVKVDPPSLKESPSSAASLPRRAG